MAANFIEQRLFCLDDLQHLHGASRATTAQPRAISIPWVCGEVRAFRGSVFGGGVEVPSSRWARELFGIRRRRRRRDLRAAATPFPLAFGLSRWQLGVAVAATTVSVPFHPSPFFSRGGCKTGERGGGKGRWGPSFSRYRGANGL